MIHLPEQRRGVAARYAQSPWLWLAVTGGSVIVHGLLLVWVGTGKWQVRQPASQASTPIELITLPTAAEPAAGATSLSPGSPSGGSSTAQAASPGPAAPLAPVARTLTTSSQTEILAISPGLEEQMGKQDRPAAQPEPSPAPEPSPNLAPNQTPNQAPDQSLSQSADSSPQPEFARPDRNAEQLGRASNSQFNQLLLPSPQATPEVTPPASPQIITQPIEVPIPTGVEDQSEPSPELAPIPQRVVVPSHLTASLTATALPSETGATPDAAAQPATEVKRVSRTYPCRVTPEVMQFLGKTVALQVETDATGQVVNTTTQESSQSQAYDQLAVCLVKTWEFRPAIAQGQAVANDGLVVRITIDRS